MPEKFNEATGFAAVCSNASTISGWGYEGKLPDGLAFQGVILLNQVKSFDWQARNLQVKGQVPKEMTV
ncbi:hypothetical protein ACF5W4_18140 [Bacillota bacterium Lsc_1132]